MLLCSLLDNASSVPVRTALRLASAVWRCQCPRPRLEMAHGTLWCSLLAQPQPLSSSMATALDQGRGRNNICRVDKSEHFISMQARS